MAVDPSIALSFKPIQLADPLAQYAQIAQIQGFQNQNQVAQMQLEKARQNERYLANMREAIINNGGPTDMEMAAKFMATHPSDPSAQAVGLQMLQAQQELKAFNSKYNPSTRATGATGGFGGGAPVPSGALGSGTFGIAQPPMQAPMRAPVNALAPQTAPEPAKNALLDTNALRQELIDLSQFPNVPQAKLRASIIQKQLEEASKAFVVPNVGLVRGSGETIVASGMAPTDIKRLTAERDALPVNDPNRRLYDQAIADIGATARVAQQRLAFDQSKFAWEKSNPGYELKQAEDGTFYGVNKRTLQAVPVTVGGATPSTGASAVGGRLNATTDPRSLMATEPVVGGGIPSGRIAPAGAPVAGTLFKGKSDGLKQIPANINLAIIKNNQGVQQLSDTIKLLEQNPEATGFKGFVPGAILNRADPEGVNARAGVADIGSLVMHERSGAAVTAAESPRLVPFIPLITDDNATALKKLKRMKTIIEGEQKGLTETYSKDQGYVPNPMVSKIAAPEQNAGAMPPIYATNGKERIMSIDGGQTWTPAK
jgi:hypothetical protein